MRKTFNFGTIKHAPTGKYNYKYPVTVEVELKEREAGKPVFTACAQVGRGNRFVMGGQCLDDIKREFYDQLENKEKFDTILKLWEKYHLNDSKAWCEHNNYGEGIQKDVTLHSLYPTEEYERLSRVRELPKRHLEVTDAGMKNVPKALYDYSSWEIRERSNTQKKSTGWITYDETFSPDGLIGKPCPVCGCKYGRGWYYKPIEKNDLETMEALLS